MNKKNYSSEFLMKMKQAKLKILILGSKKNRNRIKQLSTEEILKTNDQSPLDTDLENIINALGNLVDSMESLTDSFLMDATINDSCSPPKGIQKFSEDISLSKKQKLGKQVTNSDGSDHHDIFCQSTRENSSEKINDKNDSMIYTIDGKRLTFSEINFHKYSERYFNQEEWLMKARIDYKSNNVESE
jgi:hypothetical protein